MCVFVVEHTWDSGDARIAVLFNQEDALELYWYLKNFGQTVHWWEM